MLKAVVVAAGRGTRLRPYTDDVAKCLLEVAPGVTLLDFILWQLKSAGIMEIVVATRPEHVGSIRERVGVNVEVMAVEVDEGDFGNLYTFYSAARGLEADAFLAVMSDHIFEQEVLARLLEDGGGKAVTLCLDRSPRWKDAVEGLRIRLGEDGVREAGKGLFPFEGVDTGLFLISARGLSFVEEVVEKFGVSASFADLVNHAAEWNEVGCVDVSGRVWMDVDTPEDLEEARRIYWEVLRRSLVKPGDGPVSRYLNRPISTRLSTFLYRRAPGLTANQMTVISFLAGLLSSAAFFLGYPAAGGLAAQASSVLDGVDGELARLRGESSGFGRVLDMVFDRLVDVAIILGLGLYASFFIPLIVLIPLLALSAAGVILVSYVSTLFSGRERERLRRGFPWATRDVRLFLIMIGGLINQPLIPLTFCGLAPLIFAAKAIAFMKGERIGVEARSVERRPPRPMLEAKPKRAEEKIGKSLMALMADVGYLALALYILHLSSHILPNISLAEFLSIGFRPIHFFSILNLGAVTYLGYRVLIGLRRFLDSAAPRMLASFEITDAVYRRLSMNILWLAVIVIVWLGLSPIISLIPGELEVARTLIALIFLAVSAVIIYDLARTSRRSLRGLWERLAEKVSETLGKEVEE